MFTTQHGRIIAESIAADENINPESVIKWMQKDVKAFLERNVHYYPLSFVVDEYGCENEEGIAKIKKIMLDSSKRMIENGNIIDNNIMENAKIDNNINNVINSNLINDEPQKSNTKKDIKHKSKSKKKK